MRSSVVVLVLLGQRRGAASSCGAALQGRRLLLFLSVQGA